jgi:DNA repair protein RecO (recombination protein O)
MRALHEPAYVLHSWDWSESSLIVDLFTRAHGRVVVVAKGAKRPTSQMRAVLLPFQRLSASFGSKRAAGDEATEVHTLRTAERAAGGAMPTGEALLSAFYLNELLIKLLAREDPHPALFDGYAAVMPALAARGEGVDDAGLEVTLRSFELLLLREVGLLPELSCVTSTQQPLQPDGGYGIDAERGVVPHDGEPHALGGSMLVAIEHALSASPAERRLAALTEARLGEAAGALKLNLRELLQYHLGSSPLRTRALMQDLARIHAPTARHPR